MNLSPHISQKFNAELNNIRAKALTMGGIVEKQLTDGINALIQGDAAVAEMVVNSDYKVNAMEVSIDEECTQIIARRQPTASDLRLVVAIIKTITDLERIGDEAERIGRLAMNLSTIERPKSNYIELEHLGNHVRNMLHDTLDAYARTDEVAALEIAKRDIIIDREYESILRQMITFMMEDPRQIRRSLDVIWVARSLERIGDHARNICEYIIYLVKGKDVRHTSFEQIEKTLQSP